MAQLDPEKIISNEYADLLIEYNNDLSMLEEFAEYSIHITNPVFAVVHIPINQFTNRTILEYGYSSIPSVLGPVSEASIDASGIEDLRRRPNFNLRGNGVLIGIVDSGIDYTNPIFRNADGTTRIVSIWDQTIVSENYPEGIFYGTEYSKEQINDALRNENPFEFIPSIDETGHGTMLAGIAGGNEVPESDFYGVAPEAEFVVVKLKTAKTYIKEFFRIPEGAVCYQETDFALGVFYLTKVAEIFNRPIAICIAVGTSQSAHDGRGSLSNYISSIASTVGTAVIIAAGNEGNARRHYFGIVDPEVRYNTVELYVAENESGFSMELWGDTPGTYSIDILSPTGEYISRIQGGLDINREITFLYERSIINIDYQLVESQSGDQLILVRFSDPAPGIWRFQVYARSDIASSFHIWLPMQGFISNETYFINSNPFTTVLTLGTIVIPITITAYNTQNNSLYLNASRGYTRTNIVKPEIAAPGVNVVGPTLEQGFTTFTGTSVATAHTTGIAIIMLEWGIIKGQYPRMNSVVIKKFLMRGAIRDVNYDYPNREWGYGILNVFNSFDTLRRDLEIIV